MFCFQHNAWFDIHLGDDFVELLVFSAMLGSVLVYGCFWKNLVFLRDGEPGSRGRFSQLGSQLEI